MALATAVVSVLALASAYDPPAELALHYDRAIYTSALLQAQTSDDSSNFEPGYAAMEEVAAALNISPGIFFLLVSAFFLTSLWVLLRNRHRRPEALLLLFLSLNFFPFMQGAANVTRQFIAAGILLFAFPLFSRAVKNGLRDRVSVAGLGLVVVAASSFHQSALFCLFPIGLAVLGLRTLHLALIGIALFMLNSFGFGPSLWGALSASSEKMSDYMWSFDRGAVGLDYAGGINRIDFLVFSLLPLIVHEALARMAPRSPDDANSMVQFYLCLVFPFFALSFLPYSDRLALYGWLIWPIALTDFALRSDGPLQQSVRVTSIVGVGSVALFGLYGLTATQFAIEQLF